MRGGNVDIRISVAECDLRTLAERLLRVEAAEPDENRYDAAAVETWRGWRSEVHTCCIATLRHLGKLVRERDAKRAAGASHGA